MYCGKCGTELETGAKFCSVCGERLDAEESLETVVAQPVEKPKKVKAEKPVKEKVRKTSKEEFLEGVKEYEIPENPEALQQVFVDPTERLQAKLGNGYLVNLLFKKTKKCNMLLTDKRVYFKGTMYSGDRKSVTKTTEERILDLENVTGTGFIYERMAWGWVLLGILEEIFGIAAGALACALIFNDTTEWYIIGGVAGLIAALTPCLLLIAKAIKSRKIWFFVDYAGGRIRVDAKLIGIADVRDFHKQLRRAKDKYIGKI